MRPTAVAPARAPAPPAPAAPRFARRARPTAPRAPTAEPPAPALALPPRGTAPVVRASGNVYLCIDCGWLYTQRAPFAEWKGKCPVCRAPKSRFKPYAGSNTSNDEKARLARMGGGGGAALGGRRASGEGVEGSDAGKLAGFAVAAVVIAGGLYLALNSAL